MRNLHASPVGWRSVDWWLVVCACVALVLVLSIFDEAMIGSRAQYEAARERDASTSIAWGLRALQEAPLTALALAFAAWGWRERQRVDVLALWRITSAGLHLAIGVWVCWLAFHLTLHPALTWISSLVIGAAGAVAWLFVSIVIELRFSALWPRKLAALVDLFEFRARAPGVAEAVLRGTSIGLVLLAIESLLILSASGRSSVHLDPLNHIVIVSQFFLGNAMPALHVAIIAVYQTLLVTLAIALAIPLLVAYVRPTSLALAAGVIMLPLLIQNPAVAMGAVQPYGWKLLFLLVHSAVLLLIFLRFDLLTVAVAVFTYGFWWGNHAVLLASPPNAGVTIWPAYGLWAACVLAFVVNGLRQQRQEQ